MTFSHVKCTGVSVLFTEIDFRLSPEDDRNLTATIERRTAITTPLSVLIYPITITLAREAREGVVMFQGERLHIPPEIGIPDSSMRRPSDATSEIYTRPQATPRFSILHAEKGSSGLGTRLILVLC